MAKQQRVTIDCTESNYTGYFNANVGLHTTRTYIRVQKVPVTSVNNQFNPWQ